MNNCEKCHYFDKSGYVCRRKAPAAPLAFDHKPGIAADGIWPAVHPLFDWCGEFSRDGHGVSVDLRPSMGEGIL